MEELVATPLEILPLVEGVSVAQGIRYAKRAALGAGIGAAAILGKKLKGKMDVDMTQGAAVPVSLTGGQLIRLPGKRMRRRKVSDHRKILKSSNIVTYRYQMQSPWHAPYCANVLYNAYSMTKENPGDNGVRQFPCRIYDLTSAPNFCDYANAAATGHAAGTRFNVGNVPVGWVSNFTLGTNLNPSDFVRFPRTVDWRSSYDRTVTASGIPVDNRWELEYLKRPFKVVSGGVAWKETQAGIQNYGTSDGDANQIFIPPVGRTPIHRRTEIQLTLQGADSVPTEFDILVFGIRGGPHMHFVDPNLYNEVFGSNTENQVASAFGSPSIAQGSQDNNEHLKFWYAFQSEYGDDSNIVDRKLISRHLVPIRRERVLIPPKTSIELDPIGNLRKTVIKLDWNKIRNYAYQDYEVQGVNPTTEIVGTFQTNEGAAAANSGVGFATKIKDRNSCGPCVHPSNRVYLAIRARVPLLYGVPPVQSTSLAFDHTGAGAWTTDSDLVKSKAASYDIAIRNTFEIDEN